MSDQLRVYVAGVTYTNNPAGVGGTEYIASSTGSQADEVWFQVDRSIMREAIYGEDVRKAYLGKSDRETLDAANVAYKTQADVKGAGMSNYILWLRE